ncbi:indole-3-glycerol-phosphate synthase [Secundilactobacillus kimchicus JCM 15530]|uniref:Indole-3-glycerol phosphate synthase n=1 Tax=Secundilactobacillus kimchicus JCM 15530 TaxID=1302272 RepID=A0A0R1HT89_9LACO|nr:indole-3-glycerol phosphate synthase TrpC [Secundilactobacillus kimchicus]KRK46964.1 indole-3-glycerol-phosphate synthase [Secundilactobacillus kimchicus JCM 15530]
MILDDLVAATRRRLQVEKQQVSLEAMKQRAAQAATKSPQLVYDQFTAPGMHLIGEVKQASPSKGQIATDFPYVDIAAAYATAGVTAISVLTEPDYFKGDIAYLDAIAHTVTTPVLRKDFVIDDYMLYQAKAAGASIVLLIVAILTPQQLSSYLALAHELGLAALVEAHDEAEIKTALAAGAKMIGVNNRDLKTFTVSLSNSLKLRPLVPANVAFIAESGIHDRQDVAALEAANVNGVLIGETLMRASDKRQKIADLLGVTVQ